MQQQKNTDLCIIGAGPAGIICALEYSKLNPDRKILIVEFGRAKNPEKNELDDSIKFVDSTNLHDVYESTNKGLGGSSQTWGGRCVNYDKIDFEDRPILNGGCTWDESFFKDLQKYYNNACEYFDCGEPLFDLNKIPPFNKSRIVENFVEGDVTDSVIERWSLPTRFGAKYREILEQNKNITILEGYKAEKFSSLENDNTIKSLKVVSSKNEIDISAVDFVISCGTQESTRLLLKNTHLFKDLDSSKSSLGKYYQGHLSGKIASVKFYGDPKNTDYSFRRDKDGVYLRRRFQFSDEYLKRNNLLNTAVWLDNPLYHDPKHKSGSMSFMYMAMITPFLRSRLAPPAIANSVTKGKVGNRKKHLYNIIKDFPKSIIEPCTIFYKRYLLKRKLPGIFLYSEKNEYALHFHSEQIPLERNKMYLDKDNDTLMIDYTISDKDIDSVIKLHEKLDAYLRELNCGELIYWFKKEDLAKEIRLMSKDGIHQSGTTRIAENAEKGVVDKNLQVFGSKNLYVCSSSVFPTSSQANPTFLIGAIAVRLAHYLK